MKVLHENTPKMLFVCRGSIKDGVGHITRTRTVADSAVKSGEVRVAVLGDSFLDALLRDSKFEHKYLNSDIQVLDEITSFKPDILFLDMTYIDSAVFDFLRSRCDLIISLSPIFSQLYQCDMFFHRSRILPPQPFCLAAKPIIKCGLEYTVISPNCRKIDSEQFYYTLNSERLSVAISMGGTDAANKTLRVLETVKSSRQRILFWVLLGEGYAHSYQALVDCISGSHHEVIIAKTNDSMWRILSMCSLAILAGGVTTYEAAFAGLPSINLLEDLNHSFLIQELEDKGVSIIAEKPFPEALSDLNFILDTFAENRGQLLKMHEQLQGVIDGGGAARVVDVAVDFWRQNSRKYKGSETVG